jgi:diguanylate cyclase (GGDEF)-like protein
MLLNTQGDGLRALGRAEEAMPILQSAIEAYRRLGNPRGEVDVATDLAAALLEAGRADEALAMLTDVRRRLEGHGLRDHERRLEELLALAYEKRGDPASALAHYKAYMLLARELHEGETRRKLEQLRLRTEIDKAMRESREDALTGVPNRRRFEEWTAKNAGEATAAFAVAVIDVDHFKRVNDGHSHAVGDAVLRELGRLLKAHCRDSDFVARVGGEEFVLILSGVEDAQARDSCERLRAAVQAHAWDTIAPGLAITASIGVVAGDGRTPMADLLQVADARLYEAKRAGRNRVA